MSRRSAAQMLAWIALGKPLKLTEWPRDMSGQILSAQLKLHEAIVRQRITDVRGRLGPPGAKQRIEEVLSDVEFTLLVTPHGTLAVHPLRKRHKFEEKYKINLDKWWRDINFDQDEGERAFPARQPDRSLGYQAKRVRLSLNRLYPDGVPGRDDLGTSILRRKVIKDLELETRQKGLRDPSWQTVDRARGDG
jgi:hypothetical protein